MTKASPPRTLTFTGRIRSFSFAIHGIAIMLRSQHNAWIHAAATIAVIIAGASLKITRTDWCWIVLAIVAVWTAEALNTALEFLTDVASPDFHPIAGQAKDVAAGAVLIAAIGSVIIAVLVLGPHLLVRLGRVAAVPVDLVLRLVEYLGAGFSGVPEMPVHVVHVDVEVLGRLAEPLRVAVVGPWVPHHEHAVGELHLGVHDLPVRSRHPHALAKAERAGQPGERARHVLVVEVRRDARHVRRRVCWHWCPPSVKRVSSPARAPRRAARSSARARGRAGCAQPRGRPPARPRAASPCCYHRR